MLTYEVEELTPTEHTIASVNYRDPDIVADVLGVFNLILQFDAEDRAVTNSTGAAD